MLKLSGDNIPQHGEWQFPTAPTSWHVSAPASHDLLVYLRGGGCLHRPSPFRCPLDRRRATRLPFIVAQDGLQRGSQTARKITRSLREGNLQRRRTDVEVTNSVMIQRDGRQAPAQRFTKRWIFSGMFI